MARKDHTWHHIHTGLIELGYVQVATHNDKLYYKRDDSHIMLIKSNHIDRAVVVEIAALASVEYDYFVNIYRRSYLSRVSR